MLESWLQPLLDDFLNALNEGRPARSIIISGGNELGAHKLAAACARAYLCSGSRTAGCACPSCRALDGGSSPDLLVVNSSTADEAAAGTDVSHGCKILSVPQETESGRRSVRIDSMRRMTHWVNESAVFGHGKAVIINNAQTMTESTANAVLKTFEEPPADTLIIMLSRSLDVLLPTIISRAYKIVIPPLTLPEGCAFLRAEGIEDEQRARAALALSGNTPFGALELIRNELDLRAVELAGEICAVVSGKSSEEQAVKLLLKLSGRDQATILGELVLEILKYQAGCNVSSLPLLTEERAQILMYLPADHLFQASFDLRYVQAGQPLLPPRAPSALLRAWLKALKSR